MTAPRPNTFIVGAPRCGTTAWMSYLSTHPGIAFSRQKEPHYFSTDFPGFRWARSQDEYLSLFDDAGAAPIVAEASVQYLYSRVAAERIRAFAPQARILIFLRRQRSFLPSYHQQLTYNGDETLAPFEAAWRLARTGRRGAAPASCREPAFLDYPAVGRFDEQVSRFVETFPARQILALDFDDWTRDPRAAYLRILRFLDLPDDGRMHFPAVHGAKRHRLAALARLTQRPPAWALALARAARTVSGRARLGMAAPLRRLNARPGYGAPVPEALLTEIDRYFEGSNRRLAALLARLEGAV